MYQLDPVDSERVEDYLAKHNISILWIDRIMEAVRTICISNSTRSAFSITGVSSGFPLSGSFRFIRTVDNRAFTLQLRNRQWLCS